MVIFYSTMSASYWIQSRRMRRKIKPLFITFSLDQSITGINVIELKSKDIIV